MKNNITKTSPVIFRFGDLCFNQNGRRWCRGLIMKQEYYFNSLALETTARYFASSTELPTGGCFKHSFYHIVLFHLSLF